MQWGTVYQSSRDAEEGSLHLIFSCTVCFREGTYAPINICTLKISLAELVNAVTVGKAKLSWKELRKKYFFYNSGRFCSFLKKLFIDFPSKHLKALALNQLVSPTPARAVLAVGFRNACAVHLGNCLLLYQPIYIFFHSFLPRVPGCWTFLILFRQFSLVSKNTGEVKITWRPPSGY